MLAKEVELLPGMPITSPGGRRLEVGDIFVPKHDKTKSRVLPPSFRDLGRKVVVFRDGSIAPLAEVRQRFHPILSTSQSSVAGFSNVNKSVAEFTVSSNESDYS